MRAIFLLVRMRAIFLLVRTRAIFLLVRTRAIFRKPQSTGKTQDSEKIQMPNNPVQINAQACSRCRDWPGLVLELKIRQRFRCQQPSEIKTHARSHQHDWPGLVLETPPAEPTPQILNSQNWKVVSKAKLGTVST